MSFSCFIFGRFQAVGRLGMVLPWILLLGALPAWAQPDSFERGSPNALEVCFAPGTPSHYVSQRQALVATDLISTWRSERRVERSVGMWAETATDGSGLQIGEPITLTWSYVPDGTMILGSSAEPAAGSNLREWLNGLYPGGFAEWHQLFVSVFERWSEVAGVSYVYEPNDDGATFLVAPGELGVRGDVRIGAHLIDGFWGILGYNFTPPTGGDMVLDSADGFYDVKTQNSRRLRNVLAHEHGHGLGLGHVCPANGSKLMEPFASDSFDGPQTHDILGAQRYYGDELESNDEVAEAGSLPAGQQLAGMSVDSSVDWDWFRLDTNAGDELLLRVDPEGEAYLRGPQTGWCDNGDIFDPKSVRDLALDLFAPDGETLLASADATSRGEVEILSHRVGTAGPHWLRVSADAIDEPQLYRLSFARTATELFGSGFEPGDLSDWTRVRNGSLIP